MSETAADLVGQYREAAEALRHLDPDGGRIGRLAQQIVDDLGPRVVVYTVECVLGCGNTFTHEATVAEAAGYRFAPRGICGRCA